MLYPDNILKMNKLDELNENNIKIDKEVDEWLNSLSEKQRLHFNMRMYDLIKFFGLDYCYDGIAINIFISIVKSNIVYCILNTKDKNNKNIPFLINNLIQFDDDFHEFYENIIKKHYKKIESTVEISPNYSFTSPEHIELLGEEYIINTCKEYPLALPSLNITNKNLRDLSVKIWKKLTNEQQLEFFTKIVIHYYLHEDNIYAFLNWISTHELTKECWIMLRKFKLSSFIIGVYNINLLKKVKNKKVKLLLVLIYNSHPCFKPLDLNEFKLSKENVYCKMLSSELEEGCNIYLDQLIENM